MQTKSVRRLEVILIIMPLAAALYAANSSQHGITKADILNVWLGQEGRLEDFFVGFDFEMITKDKKTLEPVETRRFKNSLATKGDLFKTRRQEFEGPQEMEILKFDHQWSADGNTVFYYDAGAKYATVQTKLPTLAAIKQNWASFYNSACWRMPLREPGDRAFGANLIGVLQEYPDLKIIDKAQPFGGRNTIVLELTGRGRLYLDPELAFAVVGFESTKGDLHRVNSQFKELTQGFWLPMRSEWRNERRNTIEEITIQVTELKVNQALTPKDFRIEFPRGTRIFDRNINAYLPPTEGGVSDQYLQELLYTAVDEDMIDVHHVEPAETKQTTTPPDSEVSNVAGRDEAESRQNPVGTVGLHRWQAIVAPCALALAALILIVYYWYSKYRLGSRQD